MTRPTKISEIVGQESAKTVLNVLVKSSQIRGGSIPHILLSGPPGTGKSSIAACVAHEKNSKLHTINAASINKIKDIQSIISIIKDKEILFIDEIHNLNPMVCEWMYTIMEDFLYYEKVGGHCRTVRVPTFTVIGASTSIGRLPAPMKDRFKFVAELVEYTQGELCKIVQIVCKSYKFKLSEDIAAVIAKTCRSTPRLVVSRTEWIRDYMIANSLKKLSADDVINIIKLQGIDQNGLDNQDHRYLKVIKEHGPIGINQIASKMNTDKDTIINDIEPYLTKMGLVQTSTSGRIYGGK